MIKSLAPCIRSCHTKTKSQTLHEFLELCLEKNNHFRGSTEEILCASAQNGEFEFEQDVLTSVSPSQHDNSSVWPE